MQPFTPRFSHRSVLAYAGALLAAGCLLGACDRHSADDLPESYGHGSSHKKQYNRHATDSNPGGRHFSDSKGIEPGEKRHEAAPEPTATPGATVTGQMFPNGN